MTAPCPRCKSPDTAARSPDAHRAAHGAHTSLHLMTHVSPLFGLLAAVLTALTALTAAPGRVCRGCGHRY